MNLGVLERYKEFLPVTSNTPLISLGEGDTPLVASNRIIDEVGCERLFFKLEGCNPTGSFKDRGMVVAVAKAMEKGVSSIACASTGNTSASAAAYGAHYNLRTTIIVPKGKIAKGKLAQAVAYGAHIAMIDGNFDQALNIVKELCEKHPIELVNSINPNRIEGQKTASFEIIDDIGSAPDHLFIPVGNAGNITAYWKGFLEAKRRNESNGIIDSVSDSDILEAYKKLASMEGIFCEPASAASLAGLLKKANAGEDFSGKSIVCVLTGNGLKDPDISSTIEPVSMNEYSADISDVERALDLT